MVARERRSFHAGSDSQGNGLAGLSPKISFLGERIGIDFAVETMLALDGLCDGFHVMTVREDDLIPKVLEAYYARRKTL